MAIGNKIDVILFYSDLFIMDFENSVAQKLVTLTGELIVIISDFKILVTIIFIYYILGFKRSIIY